MSGHGRGTGEYHPALDGLRAIAVIAVVLFHAGATSDLTNFASGGFIGVSVFFTLSGYLVTTLLLREVDAQGRFDVSRFWARRIKRLAPASLAVVLTAVVLASTYWNGMRAADAAAGIFGYTNWHVIGSGEGALLRTIVGPLGPYWSLAVEEQFYVALCGAFLLSLRTARPVRTLSIIVVAGWFGSLAVQLLVDGPQYRLEFGTDAKGAELLAGCGLAILLRERPALLQRWPRGLAAGGAIGLGAVLALAAFGDLDPPWLLHGGYAGVSLVSAVLVASLLVPGRLTSILARTPFVVAGRMSYSWYVIHWPVILVLTSDRTGLDRWSLVALKFLATASAAALLHVAIEQPLRRVERPSNTIIATWAGASVALLGVAAAVL
ncbi:MAG: acyltransferase [Ilumatobacter sp.]|nr:acyltransferase [Ilumatobacter sp.]